MSAVILYYTIITGYELVLHQVEQWLKLVLFIVASDSNHCRTLLYFGAQSSFTQKQADQSSTLLIVLSCICNCCNINAKSLNIIFVVDVTVSSESEFRECYVAHIMFVEKQCCFDHFCTNVWVRKGPGKLFYLFSGRGTRHFTLWINLFKPENCFFFFFGITGVHVA